MTEVLREIKDRAHGIKDYPITPANFAKLVQLIDDGTISGTMAKKVFLQMSKTGESPEPIIKNMGGGQVSDVETIRNVAKEIVKANPKQTENYRAGKTKIFSFFVGQVMKAMKGKANPKIVNQVLKEVLQ